MDHAYECNEPRRDMECREGCSCSCHQPVFKVVVGEAAATIMSEHLPNNHPIHDAMFFGRISPFVFYARMTPEEAIFLATEPGLEVTRARDDWSI